MRKMYVYEDDLNEEEKRTGRVSYQRIVKRFIGDLVLCNNINDLDDTIWENIYSNNVYEEMDMEIYQYYLCNLSEWDKEYLKKLGNPLILSYSEMLDCDVLMVDHFGTSWDYVMTDVKWTTNLEEA
ncbi:MAG: hypothetical protein ACI31S_01335 [Bacilli bacterium]